jgi:hypothetical protein
VGEVCPFRVCNKAEACHEGEAEAEEEETEG